VNPAVASRPRVVLTIGKFDGVHLGHRVLAATTVERADAYGAEPTAMVIDPHPAEVLSGVRVPLLTTFAERANALRDAGLARIDRLRFDGALALLSPAAFLDHLTSRYELAGVVVGPDFAFGQDRAGDVAFLQRAGSHRGFELRVVEPVLIQGERVASGLIRARVARGDIAAAARLLGRPPHMRGRVVAGARRGRTLGYPTANLEPVADYVIPADGVYACTVRWLDREGRPQRAGGAASIGTRPTFDDGPRSVEVHLLDRSEDLYGLTLTVDWLARLRGEQRFADVSDLLVAMAGDVARTRTILAALADATDDEGYS